MGHLAKQRDASFFVLFFKTCQYGVLTLLRSLADQFDMQIEEMEIMSDHVHMLVDASPKHSISSIMKGLKGVSARMLFMHHPEIKQKLWGGHLWQPSYFAVTVSERSEEQIRHYIQHQNPSKGKKR